METKKQDLGDPEKSSPQKNKPGFMMMSFIILFGLTISSLLAYGFYCWYVNKINRKLESTDEYEK